MTVETKDCPYCAETINAKALKCKHCGEFLDKETAEISARRKDGLTIEDYSNQNLKWPIILSWLIIGITFLLWKIKGFNSLPNEESEAEMYIFTFTGIIELLLWYIFYKFVKNHLGKPRATNYLKNVTI